MDGIGILQKKTKIEIVLALITKIHNVYVKTI